MNNSRKTGNRILRIFTLVMALMLLAGTALAGVDAEVYSKTMKCYLKASTSSKYLGSLKRGTDIEILSMTSTWAKIEYEDYIVYAKLKDIILDEDERIKGYTSVVAPVYKYAGSGKLGTVPAGTVVYAAGRNGSYFMVQNYSGSFTGYIHQKYLTTKKPEMPENEKFEDTEEGEYTTTMPSSLKSTVTELGGSASSHDKLEYVIYVAQSQLGKRYSSNADVPETFDCALLVYYSYRKAGISIPSSAYAQGYDSSYTLVTSTSALQRGDVVIFDTNANDNDLSDHTGIYIGDGKFIHASSAAGKVIVSDLSSGYYSRTFVAARRILK